MTTELDSKLIGQLLALFSHDLRNPLSALQSNASFLGSIDEIDEDSREAIDDVVVACDGLAHIIDNLDLLSKEFNPGFAPQPARIALGPLVTDLVAGSARVARSHGVELVFGDAPSCTVLAVVDPFRRALANLIRNSVQHAPPGSVIRLTLQQDAPLARVQVSDDGSSIALEHSEAVFTASGQMSMKEAGARYSRGAGLLAAALAARAAGATVSVASGSPGCRFELAAPLTSDL